MMNGKSCGGVLALALVWSLGFGAADAAADPSAGGQSAAVTSSEMAARLVQGLGNQAAAVLNSDTGPAPEQRQAALRELIREGFDLELTCQFVLGKSWNRATPEQRAEFQDLFTEYLLNSYARHLAAFRPETLSIVASHPVGEKDILVETSVEGPNGAANPVWRVRAADGGFKVTDVSLDGVSLALTQRREFASVVNRVGLEGLLVMLREKLASQAKATTYRQPPLGSHASFLASILASPNANRLDLFVAGK